jgi:RND family efflux transporter MFP subunit
MSRTLRLAIIVLALLAAAAAAWRWYSSRTAADQSAPVAPATDHRSKAAPRALEFAPAELFTVNLGRIARTIPITGTLSATQQTVVKSRVAGDILDISAREGSAVKIGQLIARIDPTDFELRVRERQANVRSAEAQLEQAQRTLENNRALLAKNFISQNAFDNSLSASDVAKAALESARAQLEQARKALADTHVMSPMAGQIAQRFAQPGEKVSPDSRIVSIIDLSSMEIEAAVPASEVGLVRIGQTVKLRIEGLDTEQTGQVLRINPSTQPGTRSVLIYVGMQQRDNRVRAGLFAQGTLSIDEKSGVIVVPVAAIRELAGRRVIYAIDNGLVVEREVKTGVVDETAIAPNGAVGAAEIVAGLKAGDRIVAVNLGVLRAGSSALEKAAPKAP